MPILALAQASESLRIATFAAPLSRDGPGLLLRDILKGEDPQIAAIISVIDIVNPDILLLTDIDFDASGAALTALSDALIDPYPVHITQRPNAGVQTGLDVDGDGYAGDARDALGYGRFLGDGGLAILSRYPVKDSGIITLTDTLWRDVPGRTLPHVQGSPFPSQAVHDQLPVSSTAHWIVPFDINGAALSLLAFSATPPVFDGDEDFNGLRNRDELRLFESVLDGDLGMRPQHPILIGNVNADPFDGQGLRDGIVGVLGRSDLQDPKPASRGGRRAANPSHHGDPALDTADWPDDGPGNLRVSYILPDAQIVVTDAGVFWPAPDDPMAALLGGDGLAAGPHRLVWVDISTQGLR